MVEIESNVVFFLFFCSDSSSSLVDQSFEHAEQLSTTQSYESSMLAAASPAPQGQLVTSREKKYVPGDTPSSKDEEMIAWLKNLNLNESVVQKVRDYPCQ